MPLLLAMSFAACCWHRRERVFRKPSQVLGGAQRTSAVLPDLVDPLDEPLRRIVVPNPAVVIVRSTSGDRLAGGVGGGFGVVVDPEEEAARAAGGAQPSQRVRGIVQNRPQPPVGLAHAAFGGLGAA